MDRLIGINKNTKRILENNGIECYGDLNDFLMVIISNLSDLEVANETNKTKVENIKKMIIDLKNECRFDGLF